MRDRSEELVSLLELEQGDKVVDLTCGTGYVTNLIAEKTGNIVVGVDKSAGMIEQAEKNYGQCCEFIESDI
ncbi:MAG: class I SAM-dependent methyltransferase, partial [Proteobacteria bacterium]|nr:class I SAM-dependent methyltransferase [Pseudomonadota bacterium]